ncbi:MAG: response regulator [bacterium]
MIKPLRILLVEDDESDVYLITRAFAKDSNPSSLHVASNGEEALEYLRDGDYRNAGTIDLILLDINMHKMNGFEMLEEMRKDSKIRRIPVVMLTSSDRSQDIEKAFELGANSYVTKPLDVKKFVTTISKINGYWGEINQRLQNA